MKHIQSISTVAFVLLCGIITYNENNKNKRLQSHYNQLIQLNIIYQKEYLKANTQLLQIDSLITSGALTNLSTFEIKCK